MTSDPPILFRWLGTRDWREIHAIQLRTRDRVVLGGSPSEVLFVEHPPVITAGRQASRQDLQVSDEALEARGVDFVRAERGGHLTLHLPGQLVIYPILPLDRLGLGVHRYVHGLGAAIVEWLSLQGLPATWREDAPGVWVGPRGTRKIASVGVHVHKQVPIHGASLNLSSELNAFQLLRPCGFSSDVMTSLEAERGQAPSLERAAREIMPLLAESFGVIGEWGAAT